MSAATSSIDTPQRTGFQVSDPVAAATKIFAGTIVALDALGNANPGADAAGLKVRGIAQEDVDNSAGSAGDLRVLVKPGVFKMNNSGTHALTEAHVGLKCFVEDDNTVSSDKGTNSIIAGTVLQVESDGVWVDFSIGVRKPVALAITSSQNATAAASDLATTEALANALKTNYNAAQVDIVAIKAALVAAGIVI